MGTCFTSRNVKNSKGEVHKTLAQDGVVMLLCRSASDYPNRALSVDEWQFTNDKVNCPGLCFSHRTS